MHGYAVRAAANAPVLQVKVNLVDFFRQKALDVGHMGTTQDTFQNLAGLAEITR